MISRLPPPPLPILQLALLTLRVCHTTQPDRNKILYLDIDLASIPKGFIQDRLSVRYSTAALRIEVRIFPSVRVTVKCGNITLREFLDERGDQV